MSVRDAAYATLTITAESGNELTFLCPVHDDRSPSASLNVVKKLWVCYACGAGGRVEDLLEGNFSEISVEELELLLEDLDRRPRALPESWLSQFDFPVESHQYWLGERGLSAPTVDRFGLGFDIATNAGVMPIRDPHGALLGVVRRFLRGPRRYEYPKYWSKSEHLFGYHETKAFYTHEVNAIGPVALTEGAVDAMALWDIGHPAMAIYGSKISERQIELLNTLDVTHYVMAFDMDHAGMMARMAVAKAPIRPLVYDARWDEAKGKDVAELPRSDRAQALRDAGIVPY